MKNLVLTGGGSAGHAVPCAALIPDLSERFNLGYIGTDGIEKKIIAPFRIPYCTIACPKFIRGFSLKNLSIPARFLKSVKAAKRGLKALGADAVFSKGGYVALPVVFAAKKLGIPVISHESDLTPGLANRLISGKCREVLTSFPETAKRLKNGKYSGAPIRGELFSADRKAAREKYGFSDAKPVLLVFGGGSGSRAINEALRKDLFRLTDKYQILHICGHGNMRESNANGYVQREYENDMPSAYAAADIVLSRAGSNTVFELLALKKPALLVPLENRRSRGDQVKNALYFQERGLCRVLREADLTPHSLETELGRTAADDALKENLRSSDFKSGNEKIVNEILSLFPQ